MDIDFYKTLKTLHIIFLQHGWQGSFTSRDFLFITVKQNQKRMNTKRFITMERKLLRYIMNPSFILTWIIGILLATIVGTGSWLNLKIICVFLISAFHMYCAKVRKRFEMNTNTNSEKFYRYLNEIPTVLFVIIVALAIFKPEI